MKNTILIFSALALFAAPASAQYYQWAKNIGNTSDDSDKILYFYESK